MWKLRFRTRRVSLQISRGSFLLGSNWKMVVPWQITIFKRNPSCIFHFAFVVVAKWVLLSVIICLICLFSVSLERVLCSSSLSVVVYYVLKWCTELVSVKVCCLCFYFKYQYHFIVSYLYILYYYSCLIFLLTNLKKVKILFITNLTDKHKYPNI